MSRCLMNPISVEKPGANATRAGAGCGWWSCIVYSVYGGMRSLLCSYARAAADWWAAALSTWAGTCDGAELELVTVDIMQCTLCTV